MFKIFTETSVELPSVQGLGEVVLDQGIVLEQSLGSARAGFT